MKDIELIELVEVHTAHSKRRLIVALCGLLSPFLVLVAWDYCHRVTTYSGSTLMFPWEAPPPYHMSDSTRRQEQGWGDLLTMAGLPYFDRQFPELERTLTINSDAEGFRQIDGVDWLGADVLVAGSSFFGVGSTNADIFASRLADHLEGVAVADVSLPGRGPMTAVLQVLTKKSTETAPPRVLLWGIVQRGLEANLFNPIARQINTDGTLTSRSSNKARLQIAINFLRWNTRVDSYLTASSIVRQRATSLNPYLPPMLLDHGRTSSVYMAELELDGTTRPMLFLNSSVTSSNRSLEARGKERLLRAFELVNARCQRLGIELLVVVVPDKYEMYRDVVQFVSKPAGYFRIHQGERAAATLAKELNSIGVSCVDLYPALRTAQDESSDTLLYRRADTHWNDKGIQVGAAGVLESVRELLNQ